MNLKIIKLIDNLYHFSDNIQIFEYELKDIINSIIPVENEEYSINFRKIYYNNLLNQFTEYSINELSVLKLYCLIRSYEKQLIKYIDDILILYENIKNFNSTNNYINYIKYRIEFFIFITLINNSDNLELINYFKKQVDEGNIKFKNY